ncbi:Ltp family lipoprotein [uncultured Corynebacterium sp.]|uniref:Ltp family lipoprotein n=1 Tax=uncultured Corynebacterium sp. TaxID=159447 RepID=UPI0025D5B181|nr:Ltp family lipoprotein [uncultured Corynebacterium sp.]
MPSPDSTPQKDTQKDSLQDPINGRLALIFIGAIVLVGILVAAIWHVANSKEHNHGINTQSAAASADQHPSSASPTEPSAAPANAPAKASNAPQSELNQYPTAETEATGSTAMDATESTAIAKPTDASKTQQQANDAAKIALKFNLSEKGLRENLQLQGYSDNQIAQAIEELDPDWNQQALDCARKLNEAGSPLPKDQLLEMLKTNSGFTDEQAQYAIDHL